MESSNNSNVGTDINAKEELSSAKRIGRRIREIRKAREFTQGWLGERVGLSADRIQKYENGIRKPKPDLLLKIAKALGVEDWALSDPVTDYEIGAMFAFFEMEKYLGLKVIREDGRLKLIFGDGKPYSNQINEFLDDWEKRYAQKNKDLSIAVSDYDKELAEFRYKEWEWTFPRCLHEISDLNLNSSRRAEIEERIRELEELLKQYEE